MSFMSASVSLSVMFLFRFAFRFRFKSSFFVLYLLLVCLPTPPPPPTIYYCYRGTVRKSSHFLHSASHLFQVINKISTVPKVQKYTPPQKKKINVFDNDIHTCASYLLCAKLCLFSKLYIAISIERKK